MFSKLMIFYFVMIGTLAFAQSEEFESGQYLIYDCADKHWVCVAESLYQSCADKRSLQIEEGKINLSCAPIGYFMTKRSCYQRQLFMVGQNFGTRFCLHPDWGARELEFTGR